MDSWWSCKCSAECVGRVWVARVGGARWPGTPDSSSSSWAPGWKRRWPVATWALRAKVSLCNCHCHHIYPTLSLERFTTLHDFHCNTNRDRTVTRKPQVSDLSTALTRCGLSTGVSIPVPTWRRLLPKTPGADVSASFHSLGRSVQSWSYEQAC